MSFSIDVIIPAYRPDAQYLLPVLRLSQPAGVAVRFYLIVDNPDAVVPPEVALAITAQHATLVRNKRNKGAPQTRNKGIAVSGGDWLLFLDDDILPDPNLLHTYADAIRERPEETGFIGLVNLPPPPTDFAAAVLASGSMDIFTVADMKPAFAWGATANLLIRRGALGTERFSERYPPGGGGEDVDFCLHIRERNGRRDFATLPAAAVTHPWWNEGRPSLKRPFRYGTGNSLLGLSFPQFTYYDWFNTPETILLLLCLSLLPGCGMIAMTLLAGVLVAELPANALQVWKRRPGSKLSVVWYTMLLRLAQESGVLWGKLRYLQVHRIGERFHDDGRVQKVAFYRSNTYRVVKWVLYPLLAAWVFW
ncbi:glycosyltransferase family 2 protein [Chitinophaga lutea]